MIFVGSRYESSPIEYSLDSSGLESHPTVYRERVASTANTRVHRWRAGDRLDILAATALGNPKDWWKILDCNPQVSDPNRIPNGFLLILP